MAELTRPQVQKLADVGELAAALIAAPSVDSHAEAVAAAIELAAIEERVTHTVRCIGLIKTGRLR